MKKKSVNLITAVGVLVVLSGAYVGVKAYVAKQEAADTESAEEENPEIISIASADVKSIKFVIDKKEVTFEKDGDSWVKSDETGFPVDQGKIDTLVSSLNSIKAERTLENVEDASEYELDQPDNTITVTTEDGETTVIQLGMENDSTSQEYIDLNKDSSTVYVVSNSTFSSFEGTLYDFAKSGVFPTVDSSTVSKISVDGKDSSYVVEKDKNNFWNITGDGETEKADSAKATSLASTLSSVAYASYVNYNCAEDELSQYGLDKPYAEITVDYQEEVKDDSSDSTDSSEKDSTASESDSESVDSTDDKASAENSSTDSSDSTDASDDSSSSEDTKTTTVDKQLVIYVGDEASDGSRYVTVDNKHIYTMSADTLSAVIDKAPSDLWSLIVNYLSVKNLDQLQVTYGGATNTVNVSRETSKDDDGNDKETTTYQLDGKEIESTTFTTFYNKLINMAGQKRLTDAYTPATDPEMTAVFTDSDKNQTTVTFYTYDTNYYAAVVGNKVFLVNKMTVKEMFNAYETLINGESKTEATATPTAEAEK